MRKGRIVYRIPRRTNPEEALYPQPFRLPNTRGIYTGIIFIAAISFEPRLMQWFLMSELKQPSSSAADPSSRFLPRLPFLFPPTLAETPSFH